MTKQLLTTDWDLVSQYHQGNDYAIATLFQTHFKSLYLYAYKFLSHEQDAEDCIQEVLLQLLKVDVAQRNYKLRSNPENVLASIRMRIRNKAIDIWRKNKRKATNAIDASNDGSDYLISLENKDHDVLSMIFKRELEVMCFDALQRADEIEYLDLFLEGYDRSSISNVMGFDTIQIKVLRQRVMRKIKRNLLQHL